jgi:hypothetical protein
MLRVLGTKTLALAALVVLAGGLALSVSALSSSLFVREGHVIEQSMITDAQARRKTNHAAAIDISDIVNKYMKPGVAQESADDYLSNLGFKIVADEPSPNKGESHLIFERALSDKSPVSSLGFHDEVRVFITVENGLTSKVSGILFFKAL